MNFNGSTLVPDFRVSMMAANMYKLLGNLEGQWLLPGILAVFRSFFKQNQPSFHVRFRRLDV
jgi:hypothetical protein